MVQQIEIAPEIQKALAANQAVVALESAVITHGLPAPHNLETALAMERMVRENGAIPGTTAVIQGMVKFGLSREELETIAAPETQTIKVSSKDFGYAAARYLNGGTTVAATLAVAALAGVKVFATGGIGGVHRGLATDVSNDLFALATAPVIVVCSGAKAILDLPATLETLETYGVPVVGYRTDELPAFYSRGSGMKLSMQADTPETVARMAQAQWGLGLRNGMVVAQPIPEANEIPRKEIERIIQLAVAEADMHGVHGAGLTPFLLSKMGDYTKGASRVANIALLLNNARLAAEIAVAFARMHGKTAPVT